MAIMLSGIPYCLRINHNEGRGMQSKAFRKSMKFIITGICHAFTFSMMCLSAKIWSLHDLPGLNPACSCRKYVSTLLLNVLSTILANTLPGTDSSVMPRQLLQSDRSPFLERGTIIPFLYSVGTSLFCQTILNRFVSCGAINSACFNNSGCTCIPSVPAALPFFRCFISWITSVSVITYIHTYIDTFITRSMVEHVARIGGPSFTSSVGISCSWISSSKSCNISGSGQLRTEEKCFCHRMICSSCVVAYFPSFCLIGGRLVFPDSSFTIW